MHAPALAVLAVLAASGGPALAQSPASPAPMQREATETDVNALIDQSGGPRNPERIEASKAKVAEKPPETNDPDTLVRFYTFRGQAAGYIGNPRLMLEDFRKAGQYARSASPAIDKSAILQRLANAESERGNRAAAIALIAEAISLVSPKSGVGRLIDLYANQANINVQAGNIEGADAALVRARAERRSMENSSYFRTNDNARRAIARAVGATARVLSLKGQYAEAEATHREAIELYLALNTPGDRQTALNERAAMANVQRAQGKYADAENEARQVLVGAQREFSPTALRVGIALLDLAAGLADQGRFVEAEGLVRKALEIQKAQGLNGAGGPRMTLAYTLAGQGKWREVLDEIEFTQRVYKDRPEDFERFVGRNTLFASALYRAGRAPEALERITKLYERNRSVLGEKHHFTAQNLGFLAITRALVGEKEKALAEFAEASAILLSRSRDSADTDDSGTSTQERQTRIILEAYIDLLADIRGTDLAAKANIDPVAESFRLADAAHSRGVVRALAASAARAAASNPQIAEGARRLQDAEKQISGLNGLLANAISVRAADRDEGAIRDLRQRIDKLRDERGNLMRDIERKFPEYAKLVEPKPATIADIQKTLRPGEAMVAILSGEKRTYAWAIGATGAPAMTASSLGSKALTESVRKVRKALDPNAATLEEIPVFDVVEAHKLYAELLQPLEAAWGTASDLFVVTDGALGQLPLALLVTAPATVAAKDPDGALFSRYRAVPFLVRKAAVTQLPSVASLSALRALPAGSAQRRPFIGFGDPWFNKEQAAEGQQEAAATQVASLTTRGIRLRSAPKGDASFTAELAQLPRLSDTADEVRSVAAALRADPAQAVFIGAKASRSMIKSMDLSNARIVMFATHGLVPGDLTGLNQPALALSAPAVTGNAADGLLTVEDILSLRLNADWVVLSACNTAAAQGAGTEAISGLGRAFFYAGTRALLVSNWPVETVSARSLTTDLFRRQVDNPALSRAEALRQAELALIDGPGPAGADGKQLFTYAHPIFWAPFSLVGDGGTSTAR